MHREQKQTYMQHIEDNREQNTENTETNNHAENSTQPQRTENSTYDLHKYSLDYYFEYVSIKNSNTIELYTISKDNI